MYYPNIDYFYLYYCYFLCYFKMQKGYLRILSSSIWIDFIVDYVVCGSVSVLIRVADVKKSNLCELFLCFGCNTYF